MQVITTCAEMTALCREAPRPLGLVPTMGALHEGHLSLTRQARTDNATMAASIFVNPTQFGANEDFTTYPRTFERDLELLAAQGTDLVFAPLPDEVYPEGFDTWIEPGAVAEGMEGAARPVHFRGVATVVAKLFTITRPDRAYFGQKDGQQVAVIRKMNADLNLGVEVVTMPTIREPDGLALSSRNAYLTPEQRAAAPVVYRALQAAESLWQSGERDANRLQAAALSILQSEPQVSAVDYVGVVDADTMAALESLADRRPAMIATAARLGSVRLIDNVVLERVDT
ncbi:MAG: pantoate--beta-alanine ligase [Chloroflexota bacterium]|nr:pantoate--beta-alanine ligase [Chloroflexota bacterium]MDE2682640.1 pantoate--beta-alanine ligase [Chloroflexota bacterium]